MTDEQIDDTADALRMFLMEHGDEVTEALHVGIDTSGIHQRIAHYIARYVK